MDHKLIAAQLRDSREAVGIQYACGNINSTELVVGRTALDDVMIRLAHRIKESDPEFNINQFYRNSGLSDYSISLLNQ